MLQYGIMPPIVCTLELEHLQHMHGHATDVAFLTPCNEDFNPYPAVRGMESHLHGMAKLGDRMPRSLRIYTMGGKMPRCNACTSKS